MKLLIDKTTVITLDKERRIIKDGAVAVDGDRIVQVGKSDEVRQRFQAERVINASGKITLPGLIDAHSHVVLTLSRGFADDVDFFTWLYDRSYPFQAAMSEEDAYLSALLGCLEMLKTGTTCFAEPGIFLAEGAVRAVEESGLRAVVAKRYMDTIVDANHPQPQRLMAGREEAVERHREFFQRFHGAAGGRIRVWIGMGDPRGNSAELLVALKELADSLATGAEIHVATAVQGVKYVQSQKGLTDVEYLNRLGILGPNMLLIHAAWLTDAEVELIKKHDVKVCHCPGASLHGAYGACSHGKFPELIRGGATVCLGTDLTSNNNSLDMFRAMYQAATCHKEARLDATVISPEQALEMATINGARALMWEDEIGSLEVGKKADLILVDVMRPNWLPLHDFSLVPNMVYSGDGADVDTVIVDGRVIMEGGEVQTLDEKEVLARAQEAGVRIFEKSGLAQRLRSRWPVI